MKGVAAKWPTPLDYASPGQRVCSLMPLRVAWWILMKYLRDWKERVFA